MPLITAPTDASPAPGGKRRLAVILGVTLLVIGAVGVWAGVHPGSYGRSGAGCVTVTVPSSTGGGLLHECGTGARAMCRHAFRHSDRISLLTRPQCRLARLG